jgi:hypothetical protein
MKRREDLLCFQRRVVLFLARAIIIFGVGEEFERAEAAQKIGTH